MSLLRLAFWLGLIVLLLPTDAQQQARYSNFASNAMQRASGFCDRNIATCSVGSEIWATFLRKAEFGVRLIGDVLGAGTRQSPGLASGPAAETEPDMEPGPPVRRTPYRRTGRTEPRDPLPEPEAYRPPWRPPPPPARPRESYYWNYY